MKFRFVISKLANQFFFISNLSEWHFSCRKDYNQEWLKQTGPLSKKEKQVLNAFRKIIVEYGFKRDKNWKTTYLGQYFYCYSVKEAWGKFKKAVSSKEFNIINETLKTLQNRFEKIWDRKLLEKQVVKIKKFLNTEGSKNLFKDLNQTLGNKKSPQNFTIIALMSPRKGEGITAAGGANLNSRHITLEIPKLKNNSWELECSVGVLAHEIGHILFKQFGGLTVAVIEEVIKELKLPKLLPSNLQPKIDASSFLGELSIEFLVPFGYFAQKYFKRFNPLKFSFSKSNLKVLAENYLNFKENKSASVYRLRKLLVWQLYPLIVYQIESKKEFDKDFIKNIFDLAWKIIKK